MCVHREYASGNTDTQHQSGETAEREGEEALGKEESQSFPAGSGKHPCAGEFVFLFKEKSGFIHGTQPGGKEKKNLRLQEGRTETIPEALGILKSDLKALNSSVTVEQEEFDEIMAIKPIFLVMNYE